MIPVTTFAGRRVALFGLGGSGLATAQALIAGGATVAAFDDAASACAHAAEAGLAVVNLAAADWSDFAALVLTPGVPLTHPRPHWTVPLANAAGVDIIGDIDLFCRERARWAPTSPFVAITGTNGKSTTTALISHILREAGRDVQMGGNIGTPILALEPPAMGRVHVVEVSSFQIDLAPSLAPSIGILLNIAPDHLDRHATIENYAAIKERLIAAADVAIVGVDDERSEAIALRHERSGRPTVPISLHQTLPAGIHVRGREIFAWSGHGRRLADLTGIGTLRGDHNAQNAAAAVAACLQLGLDEGAIGRALATFTGLAHRLEHVGSVGRVLLINDSKATNADSTEKALLSFPSDIHWIVGGRAKAGGIVALQPYFPRIARAYLIGEASEEFAKTLEGTVPFERCGTLAVALKSAAEHAESSNAAEPVILLSPSCASYDQYANFEARGAEFRALVAGLPGFRPR